MGRWELLLSLKVFKIICLTQVIHIFYWLRGVSLKLEDDFWNLPSIPLIFIVFVMNEGM